MFLRSYIKSLTWSYEVPPDSGAGGNYTIPGLIVPPRSNVLSISFAYVDVSFVGLPGAAFGLGIVGTPGQFLSLGLLATLPAGTLLALTPGFFLNSVTVTNDVLGTITAGKITAVIFYDQIP